eukprot:SM000002S05627  [mRNA]  locus=s2:1281840:1284775:- [translate_table: standard]
MAAITSAAAVLGHRFEETQSEYTESVAGEHVTVDVGGSVSLAPADESDRHLGRDVILYALSVGACATDQQDPLELPLVYHPRRLDKVLPTFGVLFPSSIIQQISSVPSLQFDPSLLLHAEQSIEIFKPLPSQAKIRNQSSIVGIADKGKAALIEVETLTYDESDEEKLCVNRSLCFLRGAGGFDDKGICADIPENSLGKGRAQASFKVPAGVPPNMVHVSPTQVTQALLYRLGGDYNPLHADPDFAKAAGFDMPILHGLCTFGFAARAVIHCYCSGEPSLLWRMQGRFLLHVFPGETIVTEMWPQGPSSILFQCKVEERAKVVLAGIASIRKLASRI